MSQEMPGPVDPFRRGTMAPRRPRALLPTIAILLALAVLLAIFTSFWTERLWYKSVDYLGVFTTQLFTRISLFAVFGVLMAAVVVANASVAYRLRPRYRPMSAEQQSLDRYRDAIDPLRRWVVAVLAGLLGLMAGGSAAGNWQTYLQWAHGQPFGTQDPQFHKDVSFYVFDYPWWRFLLGFGFAALIVGLLVAVVTHYIYGGIRLQTAGEKVSTAAQAHLSILIGAFVLLKAIAYWLDRYGLVLRDHYLFTGASYTDVNALSPAKSILAGIAVICALLFFANAVRPSWTLAGIGLGLLLLSSVLMGWLWPSVVQYFQVRPNEADREQPYIQRNINATRDAYGLSDVKVRDYEAETKASPRKLRKDAETVPGIRLLDPTVVSPTFQQLQQVRGFYTFPDPLDVDRYPVEGVSRDMVVALREIHLDGLPEGQQNWINEHTVYTHGYGVVAAYGNQRDADGEQRKHGGSPVWSEEDIPPKGVLGHYQPRVYFGEFSPSYSIVGAPKSSKPVEFDVPEDEAGNPRRYTYQGHDGVPIGSFFNRLLYAVKFQEGNFLLSSRVNSDSQLLYDREPRQRVEKVAPWLQVDGDPYPAVVGGRIVWVLDGYTTVDNYPYSQRITLEEATSDSTTATQHNVVAQPQEQVNYIRNSVKATVDAYTGKVTLYAWDDQDPVLRTWEAAFPNTVKPKAQIPTALLKHLRYPEDLFKVQRGLLAQYHVTNAKDFYNGSNFWEVPNDPTASAAIKQPPFYLTLRMPGQSEPAFSLTTVFTPRNRQNLSAFMAVDADASSSDYGTMRVLQLPSSLVIGGPNQVSTTFRTDQKIATATLPLKRAGADTVDGNLLTLPVGGGLLYVQPVFAESKSGTASYPLLRLVQMSFGGKVVVGKTLEQALDQLFGTTTELSPPGQPTGGGGTTGPSGGSRALAAALDDANQALADVQAAQKSGDLVALARAQQRLAEAVQRAIEAQAAADSGTKSSPTASPAPSKAGGANAGGAPPKGGGPTPKGGGA